MEIPWLTPKRLLIIAVVAVLVPVVAVGWWLFSPVLFDKTVEEEFPFAHTASVPAGMKMSEAEDVMAGMAKVDLPMEEPMSKEMATATALKTGQLKDADRFHKGEGTATIYRLPDGTHVLRLESLKVTNGPALHVFLTAHPDPGGRDEVHQEGYIDLGDLKGNIGSQNYPLPSDADPTTFNAVVIYCKPFHVVFSVASLN